MAELTEHPAFQTIIKSPEYGKLDPERRKAFLGVLQRMNPDQLDQLAGGLGETAAATEAPAQEARRRVPENLEAGVEKFLEPTSARNISALAIDTLGSAAGTAAGSAVGMPVAGTIAGGYLATQANKALGLREGRPFREIDAGDVVSAVAPVAAQAGKGIWKKYLTQPAQGRITEADMRNAAAQAEYTQKVQDTSMGLQERIYRAEDAIDVKNARAQADWQQKYTDWQAEPQRIQQEFMTKVADIKRNTTLDNAGQVRQLRQAMADRDARLQAHNEAGKALKAGTATSSMATGDPTAHYTAAFQAADQAPMVPTGSLNELAEKAGIGLKSPVDPNNPASGIARRLQSWGTRTTPEQPAGQILGPDNRPLQAATPAETLPGEVSLRQLMETVQDLGQTMGRATGQQKAALRDMYREGKRLMAEVAQKDPNAATAVDNFWEGQRLHSRNRTLEDIQTLMDQNTKGSRETGYRVQAGPIQTKIEEWRDPKRNDWANSLTKEEWQTVADYVKGLPSEPVGRTPTARPLKSPDRAIDEAIIQRNRELAARAETPAPTQPTPEQVQYGDYSADWPEPPKTIDPKDVEFPFGKFIMARIASGNLGATAMGQMGSNTPLSWIGGLLAVAPEMASKVMLATPARQAAVRKLMATGGSKLDQKTLARIGAVVNIATHGPKEEE